MAVFDIHNYILNSYSMGPFLVGSLILILGIFLSSLEKGSSFNRSLLYFCLSSGLWLFSCALILNSRTGNIAYYWSHGLFAGFVLVPATLLHLSVTLPNRYKEQKRFVVAGYATALFLVFLCKFIYRIEGVKDYYFGFYPQIGLLEPVSILFFFGCITISIVNLMAHHFNLYEDEDKRRIQLFVFCFVIASFSSIDILSSQGLHLYPSGFIAFLGFIIGMTCFKLMFYTDKIRKHAEDLEGEVAAKTRTLSVMNDELRKTQVKLLETGKKSALASLSAGIMHQISQPITAIHGFARFLKTEIKTDDKFFKPISLIEEQSVLIKKMLDDLMVIVRHREIKKDYININLVIERATHLLTDEFRIRRVYWETELADELPNIFADSVHLQQIFMNIITNSLESLSELPKGRERYIKIASVYKSDDSEINVTFEDTSDGQSEEYKKIIHEPFFSTNSKGSSIELALCSDLIAEHGGKIEVDTSKQSGMKLIVRLPVSEEVSVTN